MRIVAMVVLLAGCDEVFLTRHDFEPDLLKNCPAEYTALPNQATRYRFGTTQVKWAAAATDCFDDTADHITHLAVVDSDEIDSIRTVKDITIPLWVRLRA